MPKASIIIPAYNVGHMLSTCLKSIISQTFEDIEIIVVNDGSTDNTGEILDYFASRDPRIVPIHQSNAGVSAARNKAINIATGECIIFVDSDDTVTDEYVGELMRWSNYDFVTAGYKYLTPDGQWMRREFEDVSATQQEVRENPSRFLGKYYFGSPWATLMKKQIIDENELKFNEDIHCGEDILFITQYLMYAQRIRIIPFCGYNYYYYAGSLGNIKHNEMWKWKIQIEQALMEFFIPQDEVEQETLLSRSFDVLRDVLRDYSGKMTNEKLLEIYNHPFFEKTIQYKMKRGRFMERVLIFSMEKGNYQLYEKMNKVSLLIRRIKNKIKRTFKR